MKERFQPINPPNGNLQHRQEILQTPLKKLLDSSAELLCGQRQRAPWLPVPNEMTEEENLKQLVHEQPRKVVEWLTLTERCCQILQEVIKIEEGEKGRLPEDNSFCTLNELAEETGYHPVHLRKLVSKGVIPGRKLGGVWFTNKEAIQEYQDKQKSKRSKS